MFSFGLGRICWTRLYNDRSMKAIFVVVINLISEWNRLLWAFKVSLVLTCYMVGLFIVLQMRWWPSDEITRGLIPMTNAANPSHHFDFLAFQSIQCSYIDKTRQDITTLFTNVTSIIWIKIFIMSESLHVGYHELGSFGSSAPEVIGSQLIRGPRIRSLD